MSSDKQGRRIFSTDPLAAIKELDDKLDSCMVSFEARMSTASSASLEQLAAEVKQFKVCMKLAIDLVRTQMTQVTALVDDVESRGRRKFLLFRGIEEKEGESLKEVITEIARNTMKLVDFSPESIRFCYRLGRDSAQGGSRPVLARFHNLDIRSSVWRSKRDLKGSGVSVAEYLTTTRRSFFNEGRRIYGVNKCWSQDGSIYLLAPDGTKHRIVSQAQLGEITRKFPPTRVAPTPTGVAPTPTVAASTSGKGAPARSKAGRFVKPK